MGAALRVLIVDDSPADAELMLQELRRGGWSPVSRRVDSAEGMRAALRDGPWEVVLCDQVMPGFSSQGARAIVEELGLDLPLVIISGAAGEKEAVADIRAGGHDHIPKDHLSRLGPAVRRELGEAEVRRERKRKDRGIRESEAKYRALVEQIPAITYTAAHDGTSATLYVSPQIESLLGYSQAEYQADPSIWSRSLHPEDRERVLAEVAKCRGEARPFVSEYRMHTRDGRVVWFHDEAVIVRDEAGSPLVLQGVMYDISKRRQAEESLREERDKARKYLDIAGVILVVIDADQRVGLINKTGCDILGYEEREIVGENWFDGFVPEGDRDRVRAAFVKLIAAELEPVEYFENPVLTKSGEEKTIAWRNTVMRDEEGKVVATLSSGEDITDRRIAERERADLQDQLHQAQKMEAIGLLAGGLAHDFNNMLTVVSVNLGQTQRMLERNHPASRALGLIEQAVQDGANLARSLLTFSRKMPTHMGTVNLGAIVEAASKLLQRTLPKAIVLSLEKQDDPPLLVKGDRSLLQQVILNLAINARDAMPEGGKLGISLVAVDASDRGGQEGRPAGRRREVCLEVADTGTGMTPEVQSRIFEPFFTTKPRGQGTGLGLSVIHGIVKAHGGNIKVQSEVGVGSTFRITLPGAEPGSMPESAEESSAMCRGHGELLLVVEDSRSLLRVISSMLQSLGYEVLEAASGEAMLESFGKHRGRIRASIVDIDLPERNGLECLRKVRASGDWTPAVIITGAVDADWEEDLDRNSTLLFKPFQMSALGRVVAQMLKSSENQKAAT
jgi:PAS domain S-box-containing protein